MKAIFAIAALLRMTPLRPSIWPAALLLAVGSGGCAIAQPSFDCSRADSSALEAICASPALSELDVELSRLYGLAIDGPNLTPDRGNELKATQRGWIKGRDECWKADAGLEPCIAESYSIRIHDLREGYADARTDDAAGVSVGPVAVVCDGLDAGVSAVFVNTAEPMVSLRWLDQSIALPNVQSGSGAKYEGETYAGTATFWTKGDEALFTPPGGSQLACRIEEIG